MASEITAKTTLTLLKGSLSIKHEPAASIITQTGIGAAQGVLSVATSDTTIPLTGVTANGWAFFKNIDATNYLEIGPDSTGMIPFMRLYPGMSAVVSLSPAAVLKAKANTAACLLQYSILQV
jgi:hypothetical protein